MEVCLLVDSTGVREYFISALEEMLATTDAEISLVVVNKSPLRPPQTIHEAIKDGMMSTASFLRQQIVDTPPYLVRREVDDVPALSDVEHHRVEPEPAPVGPGHTLPDETVSLIGERADLVIRHGFGILQGEILSIADYGVLSYHHGDIRRYRGVALGFWNFLSDEPTAGVTLQRLTPELDAGEIAAYQEINIEDCYTWQEVRMRLYQASVPMLAEGVRNVADPDIELTQPESVGELYKKSDVYQPKTLGRHFIKNTKGKIKQLFFNR